MSIDFSNVVGLSDKKGTIIEVTDSAGRVVWAVQNDGPIILEVKKITGNTYAGETSYNNEQFILLDIYPKNVSSVINVSYGGLTKTLTFSGTNAKQVYFGKFNGVSDEIETPLRGKLIIEGDCRYIGVGSYEHDSKGGTSLCGCVTSIIDFGGIRSLPAEAFCGCDELTSVELPNGMSSIPYGCFENCDSLATVTIPASVNSISYENLLLLPAFYNCSQLTEIEISEHNNSYAAENGVLYNKAKDTIIAYPSVSGDYVIPNGVTTLGNMSFAKTNVANITIPNGVTTVNFGAFAHCDALTNVVLPESVVTLSGSLFYSSAVKQVTIASDTLNLQNGTVFATSSVEKVVMLSTTPPRLSGNGKLFDTTYETPCPIAVHIGCGEAYKTAEGWSAYADYIVEEVL